MEKKTLPCPFCQRPLQIPLTKNGKIGCRQCRNVSSYDAAAGTLTPLSSQNVKPRQPERPAAAKRHPWRLIGLFCLALALVAALFLLQPWENLPGGSHSTVDEVKDLLKSLAE
ncbi:MAG: hypothetical protein HDQ91_00240 [Desulfovibrio sp.]|nr:hypothetical protein [Desulfovibrio sp.]